MLFLTHLLGSYLCYIIIISFFSNTNIQFIPITLVLLGGIFPDIDHTKSKISKKIPLIPNIINFIFKHRGAVHSIIGLIVINLLIYIILLPLNINPNKIILWFSVGYISHLLLDGLTPQGVELIPKIIRIHGYIKTGSFAEKLFFFMIILSNIFITFSLFA